MANKSYHFFMQIHYPINDISNDAIQMTMYVMNDMSNDVIDSNYHRSK